MMAPFFMLPDRIDTKRRNQTRQETCDKYAAESGSYHVFFVYANQDYINTCVLAGCSKKGWKTLLRVNI